MNKMEIMKQITIIQTEALKHQLKMKMKKDKVITKEDMDEFKAIVGRMKKILEEGSSDPKINAALKITRLQEQYEMLEFGVKDFENTFKLNKDGIYVPKNK
jgi:hypothetical protein